MGISCDVASNTLTYEWSGIVQWIHDRIKQERRGKKGYQQQQQQQFLPVSLTQDATHVLTFLQYDAGGKRLVHRSFLCKVEECDVSTRIVLDLHTMPVSFTSVCFVKSVDIARRCLERRLLSLGFVEEIAMKVAYLELSNVFTLLDKNVTWVNGGDDNEGDKRRAKLMVSTEFNTDAFCENFKTMDHSIVNDYEIYLHPRQFTICEMNDDEDGGGDFVSHLNCMHARLEPTVLHQNLIAPQIVVNLTCSECESSRAVSVTPREMARHHFCTTFPMTAKVYASRSFLVCYDLDNGEDKDLSNEPLLINADNVCNFSFYSTLDKVESVGGGGKSIQVYQDEAYANLEKFMNAQTSKCEEDRAATYHRLKANELRKYLSRISQPLKKVNNDKGEIRNQNYACALAELEARGFYARYLKEYQTLYELDLVEQQGDPRTSQVSKCIDYIRHPMPSHLTVSQDFLHRLDAYFKQNQRFKKDKHRRSIEVSILPDDDAAWLSGWYVKVNARELCHQLASINYRVRFGDRFDLRQRNEICFSNLFRMFDWTVYKEDIKNVIAISVHERKLRANSNPRLLPLDTTLRLDQFFDRDELSAIALLFLASFNHICKCEDEYCHLRVTPRPLLVPSKHDEATSRKRSRDDGRGT